jgi:Putative peptidoglycan binding domain/NlpC/P60 family
MTTSIPFKRELKPGMYGFDVLAVKRALKKAGYGRGIILTPRYGNVMLADLKRFQKSRKLTPDGIYGPRTHAKLDDYFDDFGRWLYAKQLAPRPTSNKRLEIVGYAHWATKNTNRFTYAQIRPIPPMPYAPHIATDCSGFATLSYKAGEAPDPNGNHYNGLGNTSTLQAHGTRVISPKPGDLIFYRSPDHVGVYIGNGKVTEFGGPGGPREVSEWYRTVTDIRSYL